MPTHARITFVLPGRGLFGGIRVVVVYGNKLIARGHRVAIVCQLPPWPRRPRAFLRHLNIHVRHTLGVDRDHLDDFVGTLILTREEELSEAVPDGDAVLATHWLTANPVFALPASKGRKYYFIQGSERDFFNPAKVGATLRLPMHKIVVSQRLQEMIRIHVGDVSATCIPNAVDHDLFHAPPRQIHHPPMVGFMYAVAPHKGTDLCLDVIRLVRNRVPDLRLITFGSCRPNSLLPLPSNCEFHYRPAQNELRTIYAKCDVWLSTSRSEGFGLPPLEAMACRCPVVMTDVGASKEYLDNGINGYVATVNDTAALARCVFMILSDSERWRAMSEAAYDMSTGFTWERSTDRLERVLTY